MCTIKKIIFILGAEKRVQLKKVIFILGAEKQNDNFQRKRNAGEKDEQVGTALKLCLSNVCNQNKCINSPLMYQKAEEHVRKMEKDNSVATDGLFHKCMVSIETQTLQEPRTG